jgi:hypothetical protein
VHPSDLWPDDQLAPRDLAGVQAVYPTRSAFLAALPPERLFAGAISVGMAGLSNNLICHHYADSQLEELLSLGTHVTCLFLDPFGPSTAAREQDECYEPGHLSHLTNLNISLLKRLRAQLPESARDNLVLATYEQTLRFNIVIVDRGDNQTAVVQPYLPHSRGVESPTLVIHSREQGLFHTFKAVYDEILAGSTPC